MEVQQDVQQETLIGGERGNMEKGDEAQAMARGNRNGEKGYKQEIIISSAR